MGGGYWDHVGVRIDSYLEMIAEDEEVKVRWPCTAAVLTSLGSTLRALEHEMDWDLSGDRHIEDDAVWDDAALWLIRACLPAAPLGTDEGGEA